MKIIQKFEEIAKKFPSEIAVEENGKKITYGELDNLSTLLAMKLSGGEKGLVGLEFEKSMDYIIALFSVLKADKPFLVLNKQLPVERIQYMVDIAKPEKILNKEFVKESFTGLNDENEKNDYTENLDDLAYIIFTSGSTGNPKGVKVTHRGLVNLIEQQIEMFELKPKSKMLLTNSISFDASLSDIYTTLLSGATLVIDHGNSNLIETMKKFEITHLDISPSVLNILYKDIPLHYLKTIVVGGELMSENAVRFLSDKLKLVNVYGPTETTICNSMKVLKAGVETNCIGTPINGVRYLLQEGELVIETEACADGYINSESDKFYNENGKRYYKTGDYAEYKNGEYYFIGRKDRQVKIKGFRVELEEIENLLKKATDTDLLAVVYKYEKLACFSLEKLSKDKIETLPYYMRPELYIVVDEFEKNSNGKIDYKKLEEKLKAHKRNSLIQILEENFEREVDLNDTWETLNGDSLDLISVIIATEEANIGISAEDLLSNKPIRELIEKNINTTELTAEYLKSTVEPIEVSVEKDEKEKEHVLITGTTGFLGSHFLEKLLKENVDEEYYCLIRAENNEMAKEKLKKSFEKFQLESPLLERANLHYVLGDISKEKLGLIEKQYEELKKGITKVLHSAAIVNNILPYEEMYNTNVKGTLEIIKLQKPIHYVSTLSVFVGTNQNTGIVYEEDELDNIQTVYGGYAQSKYIGELLIKNSKLPVVNYRFGLLTSHSEKTYFNPKEFLNMLFKGIEKIKSLPNINLNELVLDVSPIDFAVNVMFEVYKKGMYGKTYHIANNKGASLELIKNAFEEEGERIYLIDPDDFKRLVFNSSLDVNSKSVFLTMCRFDEELFKKYRHFDLFQRTNIDFDMKNTKEILDIDFPEVNTSLIKKYMKNLKEDKG